MSMNDSYAETAVLIAVMDEDEDAAVARLREFTPTELVTFEDQLRQAIYLIGYVQRRPEAAS